MTACTKLFLFDRISHGKVFSLFLFFVQSIYRKTVTYQNSKRSGRRMMRKDNSVLNSVPLILIIFQDLFLIRVTVTLRNIINDSFRGGAAFEPLLQGEHLSCFIFPSLFATKLSFHWLKLSNWKVWVSISWLCMVRFDFNLIQENYNIQCHS